MDGEDVVNLITINQVKVNAVPARKASNFRRLYQLRVACIAFAGMAESE